MAPTTNPGSRPKTNPGRRKAPADGSEDTDAPGGRSLESFMPGEDELTSDPITSDGLGMGADLGTPHEDHDVESLESRPLALQRALRQVEAVVDAEFVAAMEKLESLGRNEEELQSRLEELYLELGTVQDSLAETSRAARAALVHRAETYTRRTDMQATVIHRTLRTDAEGLESRQRVWNQRNESAEARLRALKEDPTLADKISEFRQLDMRMDTLDLLPESYRGVVKAHHTELKTKLKDHLEEPKNDPLKPIDISVAVSIAGGRRPEGGDAVPARLLAVLPVGFDTHQRAREGANDLTARFAFRVLAALSRFVVNIGARAQPEPVDLDGLLGIELPFDDLDIPATSADLARALRDSYADARDSRMTKIHVATDIVFVSMAALEVLWARQDDAKANVGGKSGGSSRKTKNSRRRK